MKLTIAITGASGSIYAKLLLETLSKHNTLFDEVGVVWSSNAKTVWEEELGETVSEFKLIKSYHDKDYYAPFASGSAGYDAMIICPCSMGTLGRIAGGISDSLITRAADVMLKERKKLICVVRETPYNLIHISNMKTVTEAGGIICPATPSFYSKPTTIEAVAQTVVDRALTLAGVPVKTFKWGQNETK